MSLGNNRDYKTTDRTARNRLALHFELMNLYIAQGMPKPEASALAYKHIKDKSARKRITDIKDVNQVTP